MSNFGAKLEELIERNKLTAAELSRASGLTEGLISRWLNGVQDFVSHDALEAVTQVVSKKPTEQAELIRAHLLDENVGAGSHLIDIHIRGSGGELKEHAPAYRVVPPLKIQRAMEVLAQEAITDADVRSVLLGMARLCERETETPASSDAVSASGEAGPLLDNDKLAKVVNPFASYSKSSPKPAARHPKGPSAHGAKGGQTQSPSGGAIP